MAPLTPASHYSHLFRPIRVGSKVLKNRILMPAMGTLYATWNGRVTPRLLTYYRERADGGVGLIVVEYSYVHRSGQVYLGQLAVDRDELLDGLASLARAIHEGGAAAAMQIFHGGRMSFPSATGSIPLAPSAIPSMGGILPKALTRDEIADLQRSFVHAALRVKAAGFDAVELHMGHGYLIHSFLTPLANNRNDEYGGELPNRARFALGILREVRAAVGPEFVVMCKISGSDYAPGGLSLAEIQIFAKWLQQDGADAITVSGGYKNETDHMVTPPMALPRGFRAELAHQVKSAVSIPVVSVGRINQPAVAESILAEHQADMVAVGRGLIADPQWPAKAATGRADQICPCIACNQGCIGRIMVGLPVSCLSNPAVGREGQFRNQAVAVKKKVVVVGGGPAGMTAARTMALRGHRVTLLEKRDELGGRLATGSVPPHKHEIRLLISYMVSELNRLNVDVRLGCEAVSSVIAEVRADQIILATGAGPILPNGVVAGENDTFVADDVLLNPSLTGEKVAIVGGGMVGLETAEFLAVREKQVVILEMTDHLGSDLNERARKLILERLWSLPVEILLKTRFEQYTRAQKTVEVNKEGVAEILPDIDSVVLALGYESRPTKFTSEVVALDIPVSVIGDALSPRSALEAIREGFEVGFPVVRHS